MSASALFDFLRNDPVVIALVLLVLLVTVVPLAARSCARLRRQRRDADERGDVAPALVKQPQTTRFMGTQFDLAILALGLLLVLVVVGWIRRAFLG
jgi:hypothetical protein